MVKKIIRSFLIVSFLFTLVSPIKTNADALYESDLLGIGEGLLGDTAGFDGLKLSSELNPRSTTINIINLVLSFLGLIAIILILIGGFKWMTSGGSEDKVTSAKKLLISGLIGLVIVLLSWGIATWVIGAIDEF